MKKYAKLLTLGLFSIALAAGPVVTSVYAAPDEPPPSDSGKKKKKSEAVRPGSEETAFAAGYRAAYAAIYERGEYASAIEQLKALHRDIHELQDQLDESLGVEDIPEGDGGRAMQIRLRSRRTPRRCAAPRDRCRAARRGRTARRAARRGAAPQPRE